METPAVGLPDLVSNLGGSMGDLPFSSSPYSPCSSHQLALGTGPGLFLGISVFSLVEVLTFAAGLLCGFTLDQ